MSTLLTRIQASYTNRTRALADVAVRRLGQSRITPTAFTSAGVLLSIAGAVIVYFEYVHWGLLLVGSFVFFLGALLDILDGALARTHGLSTPFGAFFDSTVDRVGEGFMLGAVALVLMRKGNEWGVALAVAALGGSFLVSYARARAEHLRLSGAVGLVGRTERVAIICLGLALAPLGSLPWVMVVLTATAWITVAQRVLAVRRQLEAADEHAQPSPPQPPESRNLTP